MFEAAKYTHMASTAIYMLLLLIFGFLLLAKKEENFEKMDKATKVFRMIIGALILISGIYLLTVSAHSKSAWVYVKIVGMLAAIALGVVGMKKKNGLITLLSGLVFVGLYGYAEMNVKRGPQQTDQPQDSSLVDDGNGNVTVDGKTVYHNKCELCHGEDGAAGLSGASDLTVSEIPESEIKDIINNGRGQMVAVDLSEDELNAVTEYVLTLRN